LLNEISLLAVDLCNEILKGLPAESPDALQDGEFRGRAKEKIEGAFGNFHA
jgi:hypothetical protein